MELSVTLVLVVPTTTDGLPPNVAVGFVLIVTVIG